MSLTDYVALFAGIVLTIILFLVIGFIIYRVRQIKKEAIVDNVMENVEERRPSIEEEIKDEQTIDERERMKQEIELEDTIAAQQKIDRLKPLLKKYSRKRRKRLRELYAQYEQGLILQVENGVDNKAYMEEMKSKWANS